MYGRFKVACRFSLTGVEQALRIVSQLIRINEDGQSLESSLNALQALVVVWKSSCQPDVGKELNLSIIRNLRAIKIINVKIVTLKNIAPSANA